MLARELVQPLAKQVLTSETAMSLLRILTGDAQSPASIRGFEGHEAEIVLAEVQAMLDESTQRVSVESDGYLLAARWLLPIGRDDDKIKFDLAAALRDTGQETLPVNTGSQRGLKKQLEDGNRGIHSHVAFLCLKRTAVWSRDTLKSTHNAFAAAMGSPRVRDVARVLAAAIEERFQRLRTDPEFLAIRKAAWTQLQEPPIPAPAARPLPQFFYDLADRVDVSTEGYPSWLTPRELTKYLTLSPLGDQEPGKRTAEELYSTYSSQGGKPANNVVKRGWRLVVLGNPGGGKSTVLAATVANRIQNGSPAIVVRLSALAARTEETDNIESVLTLMVKVARDDYGIALADDDVRGVVRLLTTHRNALIALDGLDEIQPERLEHVRSLIGRLSHHQAPILVSSRLTGYINLGSSWNEAHVDELSPTSAQGFLKAWFRDSNVAGLDRARAAVASSNHEGLATVPVLLGIVASVAQDVDVPPTRAKLYERYVEQFLQQTWKPINERPEPEEIEPRYEIAKELALKMATGRGGDLNGANWTDVIAYGEVVKTTTTSDPKLARVLTEKHGLLTAQAANAVRIHQQLRWIHRTVHEHLVGAALADKVSSSKKGEKRLDPVLLGPRHWDAPLRHMGGLLAPSDLARVVKRIDELKREGDPGRVLANFEDSIAQALPYDSEWRRELARTRFAEGQPYSALLLDEDYLRSELAAALRDGNRAVIRWGSWLLPERLQLSEREATNLVEAQRNSKNRSIHLYVESLARLSEFKPDEALQLLLDVVDDEHVVLTQTRWRGTPSVAAVRAAVERIVRWEPRERLPHLVFIEEIGGDLLGNAELRDLIEDMDLETVKNDSLIVDRIAAGSSKMAEIELMRSWWTGHYGDEFAYIAADGAEEVTKKVGASPGAKLRSAVKQLSETRPGHGEVEPTLDMALIDRLKNEPVSGAKTLSKMVLSVSRCLENAPMVPIGWAVETQVRLQAEVKRLGSERAELHRINAIEAIAGGLLDIMLTRPRETKDAVLAMAPGEWPEDTDGWKAFEVLSALNRAGELSSAEVARFIKWAAQGGLSALPSLRLGTNVEKVLGIVETDSPEAFVVGRGPFSAQLAELGMLHKWRKRISGIEGSRARPSDRA